MRRGIPYRELLFIADPPSPPQIHGDLRAEQKSGDKVKLTCSTDGGNPLPTLTWLRNDIPLRERSILEKGKNEVRRTEEAIFKPNEKIANMTKKKI